MTFPLPENEDHRLAALSEYGLLDTPAEEALDRIVRLAAKIFNTPTALISLIDRDRQFFKARTGLDTVQTPRDISFCTYAVAQDNVMVVPDALLDPRFMHNPMVASVDGVRFYASAPLVSPAGYGLGTLCIVDTTPRAPLSSLEEGILRDLASMVMDQFEIRRLEMARHVGLLRFENIAASSPDAILCTDEDGLLTFWNPAVSRMFGYADTQLKGVPVAALIPEARALFNSTRDAAKPPHDIRPRFPGITMEANGYSHDGRRFPVEISLSMWSQGPSSGFGVIIRDQTVRRETEAHLYRLAHMDGLTEMVNRDAFVSVVSDRITANAPADLLLIDLDDFKVVNDTWGHVAGDQVLRTLARRIRRVLSDTREERTCAAAPVTAATATSVAANEAKADAQPLLTAPFVAPFPAPSPVFASPALFARMGGDEFAALLPGNLGQDALGVIARRLMSVIAEPVTVGEQSVSVSACVGIASYPADADGAEELLANADLALYQAKADGPLTHRFFVHSLREAVIERRILEAELRDAFAAGQLELFYQPQIDLLTRRVLGAEALLRWRHPARGLLLPADFIDVLETSAIAPEVGEKIIETACAQAARWRASGFPDFQMSVNLFGRQIVSGRLVELVMGPIKKYGLPPSAIEIEITETTILRRDDVILAPLRQLCAAGVRIAFDDYGTGYASLSLLKDFPLSRLKIDRSFITHLADDAEDAAVVQAIIFLAKNFGLRVIAEGVETEAQAQILIARHCPEAQGFLFGRAVSADEFEKTQLKTLLGDEACAM